MKSTSTLITEGMCYVVIAAGAPFVELLISDRDLSQRALMAAGLMALVAGANSLKAFLSQSMNKDEPMEVKAPEGKPLEVTESKTP